MTTVHAALTRSASLAVAATVTLAAVVVASGGGGAAASAHRVAIATPMATSITTTDGTWATVPMGRLDQPANTFWQLLYRAPSAATWSNKVQSTAVATNGGIVMTARQDQSVIVGVRPSNLLTYSPLLTTSDAGQHWTNGLIPAGLSRRAAGLATDGDATLALVGGQGSTRVVQSASGLATWSTLVTSSALEKATVGRACNVTALTAVAYLGEDPLVGASCARPGVTGIFERRGTQWQLASPALPAPVSGNTVEVLSLVTNANGATALLKTTRGRHTAVFAAWTSTGSTWQTSPAWDLGIGDHVASVGPTAGNGMFVLIAGHGATSLITIGEAGSAWERLPSPPASTKTVAFGGPGGPQALAVNDKVLSVWGLPAGSGTSWSLVQTMHVALQYGSST